MSPVGPLATAFLLGLAHAIEVDHMIAVTAFVSTRPTLRTAAGFGLRWGLGHSIAVFVAGGILLATGLRWPAGYDALGRGAGRACSSWRSASGPCAAPASYISTPRRNTGTTPTCMRITRRPPRTPTRTTTTRRTRRRTFRKGTTTTITTTPSTA